MAMTESDDTAASGTLFIVATPIGNLADITLRALDVLRSVHLIAAEDTRHTRKLLSFYDIHKPLISYHSHNVRERGPELLEKITAGASIALVTDAGTPGISDPGALLVQQALERHLRVAVIPGPDGPDIGVGCLRTANASLCFSGFPSRQGSRKKTLLFRPCRPFHDPYSLRIAAKIGEDSGRYAPVLGRSPDCHGAGVDQEV